MDTASEQTAPAAATPDPQRQQMQDLSEEIRRMTGLWCTYCGQDHCKDRDMHFYIQVEWSYDDAPAFVAYHNGYVGERWQSPKCSSMLAAMKLLAQHLHNMLASAYREALAAQDDHEDFWRGADSHQLKYALDNFAEYA